MPRKGNTPVRFPAPYTSGGCFVEASPLVLLIILILPITLSRRDIPEAIFTAVNVGKNFLLRKDHLISL